MGSTYLGKYNCKQMVFSRKKNGSCSPWGILKIKQIIQINPSDSQKLCSDSQKCYSGKMPTKEVSCSPDFVEVLVPWLTVFKNW